MKRYNKFEIVFEFFMRIDIGLEESVVAVDFVYEEYEQVNFLGYTVTMPQAERISYYMDKMDVIVKKYNLLEECLQKQAAECKAEGSSAWAWIQSQFWLGFECEENGSIVEVLSDILDMDAWKIAPEYSVADEFGKNTKAYRELVKLRGALVRDAKRIQDNYEYTYQQGRSVAFTEAASNIKGMGYGIITNSSLNLLAYNIMSNATLKSQAKKADKQYENSLKSLYEVTAGPYKSQLLSLMFEQYIPMARMCFSMWVNEVTEKLIDYEVRFNNNSVFEEIGRFNLEKSQEYINKIDWTSSDDVIREELLEAFKECPYNESIYLKAAQAGLLDKETYFTVALPYCLGVSSKIKKIIIKECKNNLEEIELIKKRISFMIVNKADERKILKEIYDVSDMIQNYNYIRELVDTTQSIQPFLQNKLTICDIEKFIAMDASSIRLLLESYIVKIISKNRWNILVENNLIDWRKISRNNTHEYDEMNSYYINALLNRIVEYQNVMIEANLRYMESLNKYQLTCKDMENLIEQLEKDIAQIGVLGFTKKKLLKEELGRKKAELYEFSTHNKPTLSWK